MSIPRSEQAVAPGTPGEVFGVFLKLGLTSFGGPIAHLGYFRAELVRRRQWVTEELFAQLVAVCQILPGPASSQLGFSLGVLRAGWLGGIAAFAAFTLPSALLLVGAALALPLVSSGVTGALIHGLKLTAFAVVADAVMGMSKQLCPDTPRRAIAVIAAAWLLLSPAALAQLAVVAVAALVGALFLRGASQSNDTGGVHLPFGRASGAILLFAFIAILLVLALFAGTDSSLVGLAAAFYRSGALVFGGGHVVLPLLQQAVVSPGWVSQDQFLAGYGLAQAIPGPLFALAAYLGAVAARGHDALLFATVALLALFLPGLLLVAGVLPYWRTLARSQRAISGIAAINAAVVGLLGAALYDPIFISGVSSSGDMAIVSIGTALLRVWRMPPLAVVAWCSVASVVRASL
ncbi:MAG TPA: chromate efflux transporter [Gemmatimonadaceae bacterium]|nr:chromate efflux transporter [Gemmatimonadaceae bacterium]